MLVNLEQIKVTDRIRKDFGDIQELADDIKENGLINPPVVTPDTYELIAGERRLKAMKLLGYRQIEVRPMSVKDYSHQLQLEINENESRKDFTKTERQNYMMKLIELKKFQGLNLDLEKNVLTDADHKRIEDEAAKESGIGSRAQFYKEKYIVDNANPTLLSQWDKGDISTHATYVKLKKEKEELESTVRHLKSQPPKTIEKIVDNTDTTLLLKNKKLSEDLEKIRRENESLQSTNRILESSRETSKNISDSYKRLSEDYKKQSEEYMEIKSKIIDMGLEPDGEYNLYSAASEIAKLTKEIENLLVDKLAPTRYKNFMIAVKNSDILRKNFKNTLDMVNDWYITMVDYIDDNNNETNETNNYNNVIDMEEK